MTIEVDIIKNNENDKYQLTKEEIEQVLGVCLDKSNKKCESILLNIMFVDKATMLYLNSLTRDEHHATNVLSFMPKEGCKDNLVKSNFMKAEQVDSYLGEIVFCIDVVQEEAEKLKIPLKERYYMLLAHSLYHLLGFNHEKEEEEIIMNDLIIQTLLHFGIKDPYLYNCYDATDVD